MRRRSMMGDSVVISVNVLFVGFVPDVRVLYGTNWATANAALPSTVSVVYDDLSIGTVSVSWIQGTYVSNSAVSHTIKGTISGFPAGIGNDFGKQADATVWMDHEGFNDLTNTGFDGVYYDFTQLYTTQAGALVNGEPGLQDLGPNGFDAVIVGTPSRGRIQQNAPFLYSVYAVGTNCVSAGNPLTNIVNKNRLDIFMQVLSLDGLPTGSSNYAGSRAAGPQGINFYNNNARITVDVGDGTNSVSLQTTSAVFANGQTPCYCIYFSIDWVANTATCRRNGVNFPVSVLAGTIASVNPANINSANNWYIGSTNLSGVTGNHTEIVAVERFAMMANFTDAAAARVEDYFINHSYPFGNFYLNILLGDSQSEGAAESQREALQAIYPATPAEVTIYFKTTRAVTDNGTWQGFNYPNNNELLGTGQVISEDVSLCTLMQQNTPGNVFIVKTDIGGSDLGVDWLPPSGTEWGIFVNNYYAFAKSKLMTLNPGKRLKITVSIDLLTNDISNPVLVAAAPANIQTFISALRALSTEFTDCPVFWCELNTTLNATQIQVNGNIKTVMAANTNCYYLSGDTLDLFNDPIIRRRKQDLTVPEKLGVSPTTSGGDDGHRSYLGMNAKGELIFDALTLMGYIP